MASVDFKKFKGGSELKGDIKHCDKKSRLEGTHKNKHIDKSITSENFQFGKRGGVNKTWKFYKDRLAYLDSQPNANKRKDRVTCFGLEIPFPLELCFSDKKIQKEWLERVTSLCFKRFGEENIVNSYVHYDEVHEYLDSKTGEKKLSRPHIHMFVVPEIEGRLNGKEFSSKKNMRELNKLIEDETQKHFHMSFMTGEKYKSLKSVEELKNESAYKELEDSLVKEYNEKNEKLQNDYVERHRELDKRQQVLDEREKASERDKTAFEYEMKIRRKKIEEREKDVETREKEADEREQALDKREKDMSELILYAKRNMTLTEEDETQVKRKKRESPEFF